MFDDRVMNYAVEPAGKAAGLAAAVVIVAILLHVPRPLLVRRARNPSLYRASGNALTLDDDKSDAKRIVAVGLSTGVLVVGALWFIAR